ncbi:hypothetical protein HFO56_33110 [Rhizobium laguerreae]|uniref:hypothetical protein n=1 Tax=Rhizobium laguerreae TaxID=1076926 RepID=UPI001C908893|nr:hypothetical protein [Rhizobium laguerreae]MBY3157165.1 hypothetical protein [Rhizobium laguerreae]
MAKVTSTVEVADYAFGDTQTAAILSHGAGDTTYRRIGDHLYKALDHMPVHALKPGSDMARTLVGRSSAFDFGSFMTVVENAALDLASETAPGFTNVAYAGRALSRRDKPSSGLTAQLKAFDKSPQMGMAGGDEELGEWSRRFGEFMENIALVDGVVHVRSFEPCYRINLRPPETRSLDLDRMRVMEKWLGGGRQLDGRGIPLLGSDWELADNRYFSLNERERAVELADQLGFTREWLAGSHTVAVTVADPASLSSDFIKEETYRLAVAALDVADVVANEIAGFSYSNVTGRDALAARLDEIGAPERNLRALVETMDDADENALDQMTKDLASTLMREGEILNPGTARRISSLESALEFLDLRRDSMPVALLPAPRKMGS